jgi:putative transposase
LLELPRSTYYDRPAGESAENLALMRRIDEIYMQRPFYGCRRIGALLGVDKDRVRRLMRKMGIEAIYPKRKTTFRNKDHEIYPYLLRDFEADRPDQVWSSDITYVPIEGGFMYLVAVLDWYSRYVLSWRLSNTLDTRFCLEALDAAIRTGRRPDIFNTDQGCQFTSAKFTGRLKEEKIKISMDGRGRALDNVFIERLWRSVKYEDIYLHSYESPWELESGLTRYFDFYCYERPHMSLDYRSPAAVYCPGVS